MPPLDFLLEGSIRSLQDLEMATLSRAANFSKTLRVELEAWVEQEATAMLARWLVENRDAILREASRTVEINPHKVEFFDHVRDKKSA